MFGVDLNTQSHSMQKFNIGTFFRKIFTHGFVVDENGHKMSKSIGNVIDPNVICNGGKNTNKDPAFGVDTLR